MEKGYIQENSSYVSVENFLTGGRDDEVRREMFFVDYMLNHLNNLIFVANSEHRFVYVNELVIAKYGYTKEQFLTMTIPDINVSCETEEEAKKLWETYERDRHIIFHSIHKDAQGRLYPVLIHAYYVDYEGERYNFGVVEDESYIQKLLDAQDGFVILTDGKRLVMGNKKLLDFFGYPDFIAFNQEHQCVCDFFREEEGFIYNKSKWITEVNHARHNDAKVKIIHPQTQKAHIFLVRAAAFDSIRSLVTFTDITELERYKNELEHLAITDGLTSLYNRRYFNQILPQEINRAKRNKKCIAFIMLDIDFFKQYNDAYGHLKGDETLVKVAHTIKHYFNRASDFCFRLGGEEFGIICTVNSPQESLNQAKVLRKAIEKLEILHTKSKISPFVTASLGIIISDTTVCEDNLYSLADEALYRAKETGRNCICVHNNGCFLPEVD